MAMWISELARLFVLAGSGNYVDKTGIINGQFYFDHNPVVAYMAMPEFKLPKEGADV